MNERFMNRTAGVNADGCGCEGGQRSGAGRPNASDCGHSVTEQPGRAKLLKKIQEYNFMMIEAALYLNNQPCCEAAQEAFCKYRELYLEALAEYEECYGPLTYNGADVKRDGWKWVNTPWPWEVEEC